jgi:hypothetical protein
MPKLILENGEVLMNMDAKDFLIYNPQKKWIYDCFQVSHYFAECSSSYVLRDFSSTGIQ